MGGHGPGMPPVAPGLTSVLLYAKMLNETENEETRLFCQIFVIGGISIEGARAPWATPWLRL